MAENEHDHEDRTEQPSAKRLDDARERGQVPRSKELAATAVVIAGALALLIGRDYYAMNLARLFELGLHLPRAALFDAGLLPGSLVNGLVLGLQLLLPVAAATIGAAVLGTVALGGWAFSTQALTPDFSRLNPATGLTRLFSVNGLIELVKALAKFAIVALIAGALLWHLGPDFLALGSLTLQAAITRSAWLAGVALAGLAASLIVVAVIDVPFQFWNHRRQLRMTKQEAKDEMKETEGRPEVRSRIRNLQRSIANRRMLADVPKADVVAMNPTHYAVALRYEAGKMKAPRVVAKGADLMALQIRRIAEAHKVPVFEHPQFARALYFTSEVGKEISPRLYVAVAQVLTYIYQLTGRTPPGGKARPAGPRAAPKKPELSIDADLSEPRRPRPSGMAGVPGSEDATPGQEGDA
ncbi:MAG TPA: flagellar biosynthesis protein FlhB [Gammaproteobacteria bacterium]|nr:flagellar biosynthesis protein FlhB [Gammaproteobacteria bacterium]